MKLVRKLGLFVVDTEQPFPPIVDDLELRELGEVPGDDAAAANRMPEAAVVTNVAQIVQSTADVLRMAHDSLTWEVVRQPLPEAERAPRRRSRAPTPRRERERSPRR